MRNLKKVLALVLAMAMSLSLAVTAGAAFNDQDKIVNDTAVDVCSTLGIINGYTDGSFKPEGNVTRAEMAKMICIVLNGGKEPTTATKAVPTYADIDGHWAEGYIEYCSAKGVVAGVGGGNFNPNGSVTGSQAAKMLLVALGYNADVEKMVGGNWELYTNVLANQDGLYEDLEAMDPSAALTRDNAAQMIYNTLNASTIKVTSSIDRNDGSIVDSYDKSGTDLLADKFGAKVFTGTFDGDYNSLSISDGNIQVTGLLDTDPAGASARPADFPYELDLTYVGEEVEVLYKEGKAGIANEPDKKDTIYGVYVTGATEVVYATPADIEAGAAGEIEIAETAYDVATVASGATVIVKNGGVSAVTVTTTAEAAFEALAAQNGNSIKFILNDDGEVAKAYVVESTLSYVTAVNSEKATISGIGSLKFADHDIYDGIAKDDVVVVTKMFKAADADATFVIEKAEVVSGTVNGIKNAGRNNDTITLDGTVYSVYNEAAMLTGSFSADEKAVLVNTDIGETYDLYLVNGYAAAAVQTSEDASNYSLVIDSNGGTAGDKWNPLKVVVLNAEGTEVTLTVDEDSASVPTKGDIITYTGTEDNALVTIEADWAACPSSTANFYDKTSKTLEGVVTTADCVLFVQTESGKAVSSADAKFKAYNIRELGDIAVSGVPYMAVAEDGKVVAAIINLAGTPAGATSTAVYGIVTADNGTVEIGDNYYTTYAVYTNAGDKTVNLKTGSLTVGGIYKFEPSADNCYDAASSFTAQTTGVAIEEYDADEGLLTYYTTRTGSAVPYTFGGLTTKAVADDLVVLYINADEDVAGEEIGINAYDEIEQYLNAIVIVDDEGVITHVIIETSNECDIV